PPGLGAELIGTAPRHLVERLGGGQEAPHVSGLGPGHLRVSSSREGCGKPTSTPPDPIVRPAGPRVNCPTRPIPPRSARGHEESAHRVSKNPRSQGIPDRVFILRKWWLYLRFDARRRAAEGLARDGPVCDSQPGPPEFAPGRRMLRGRSCPGRGPDA